MWSRNGGPHDAGEHEEPAAADQSKGAAGQSGQRHAATEQQRNEADDKTGADAAKAHRLTRVSRCQELIPERE